MRSLDLIWLGLALPLAVAGACSSGNDSAPTAAQTASSSASAGGAGGSGGANGAGAAVAASVTSIDSTGPGVTASTGNFGSGGGGGGGCDALASNVLELLNAAQKCGIGGPVSQCTDIVGGLCCPVLVTNKDSSESNAYEQELLAYQNSNCKFECPPMPCNFMPQGECSQDGPNSSTYHCSPK